MGVHTSIRWVVDKQAIRELKSDPDVGEYISHAAEQFGDELKAVTPTRTGAGAASIRAHPSRAVGATDVGWDAQHYYLIFPEYGTKHQAPQRFARALLDRYTYE